MDINPWGIIGWIVICCAILAVSTVIAIVLKVYVDQALTDRERRRAQAGKVRCYVDDCHNIATRQTPIGFYCETHALSHSKKHIDIGSVSWTHQLDWTIKKAPSE